MRDELFEGSLSPEARWKKANKQSDEFGWVGRRMGPAQDLLKDEACLQPILINSVAVEIIKLSRRRGKNIVWPLSLAKQKMSGEADL